MIHLLVYKLAIELVNKTVKRLVYEIVIYFSKWFGKQSS